MYEIFEHTADLGLRIRSADLDGLFEEAARALFSAILANFDEVRPGQEVTFEIEGDQLDELLRDWLADLLYTFHAERLVLADFEVNIDGTRLSAVARGEPIDPRRLETAAGLGPRADKVEPLQWPPMAHTPHHVVARRLAEAVDAAAHRARVTHVSEWGGNLHHLGVIA